MDLSWLQVCAEGQTEGCVPAIQLLYLAALVVGVVLLAIIAVRSRDLSTATLALMPVAIAINIAVGGHHRRPAAADLPGFDRHGPRRRGGRAVGRGADGPPVEPDLGDPPGSGRGRPHDRLLRAGRRRDRPDGGLLGGSRRIPPAGRRRARRRVPGPRRRGRGRARGDARRPADGRPLLRSERPRLADALRPPRARHRRRSGSSSPGSPGGRSSGSRPAIGGSRDTSRSRPRSPPGRSSSPSCASCSRRMATSRRSPASRPTAPRTRSWAGRT